MPGSSAVFATSSPVALRTHAVQCVRAYLESVCCYAQAMAAVHVTAAGRE